jgi:hypothetical protein
MAGLKRIALPEFSGTIVSHSAVARCLRALLVVGLLLVSARPTIAQFEPDATADEPPPPAPLFVLHVQSAERILQRMQENLRDIDRSDVSEAFDEFLENSAGGLKGFDRSQPFGVAMFLPESLPPRPVPVMYAPVTDFGDLIKTLELGPVTVKRQTAEEQGTAVGEHYTLTMQNGMKREIVVRDGYAFLARDDMYLDGDVANLAKLAPRLGDQYDAALAINITAVSPLVRDVFLGMLRNQSQIEMQQRDDEPMSQYIVRKANAQSTFELIEHVLRDGESLTLGIKFPEVSGNTVLELFVDATPDSDFAQYLADLSSHPSAYSSLVNDRDPMTLSASWMMAQREQRLGREWISSLAHAMTERLRVKPDSSAPTPPATGKAAEFVPDPAVQDVVNALNATVDNGHFDVCFQFRELEPGRFGLIGAMHVVGGETLAGGIRELLTALQSRGSDFEITQDVASHGDIALHRVRSSEQRAEERRVYGEDSGLYVGASAQTLWFAVGSSRVLTELNSAIDRVAAAATQPATRQPPIQLIVQSKPWQGLSPEEPDGPVDEEQTANRARRRELEEEAFSTDNDGIKLEVRPTETGARVRIELEPGFARMLSLIMAERYDRSRL